MNVLAFDTCLGAVSVAVRWQGPGGDWLTRHAHEARERGHAERLMPMIAEVMEDAGLAFSDLDRIAVTVGPGTFTGVRVGVAAARGLALASGVIVYAWLPPELTVVTPFGVMLPFAPAEAVMV